MAREIYTTFSFLGASGWPYSKGGPTLYILGSSGRRIPPWARMSPRPRSPIAGWPPAPRTTTTW